MQYVRPRLSDCHNLAFTQEEVDFAIPFVSEDIPLVVDPFLLWKSPSLQDNSLHTAIANCFNHLGHLIRKGQHDQAAQILVSSSECDEVGFGESINRKGKPIGRKVADEILALFRNVPQIRDGGFIHFEEIQLMLIRSQRTESATLLVASPNHSLSTSLFNNVTHSASLVATAC